jgi:hypothetical protein
LITQQFLPILQQPQVARSATKTLADKLRIFFPDATACPPLAEIAAIIAGHALPASLAGGRRRVIYIIICEEQKFLMFVSFI